MRANEKPSAAALALCLLDAGLLCAERALGSRTLLLLALALFSALALVAAVRARALPVLLFFLPWAKLLKLSPDGHSFYTFALVATAAIHLLRARFQLRARGAALALALLALTLSARALAGRAVDFSYLAFFWLLLLAPVIAAGERRGAGFAGLTAFFALGVLAAALSARALAGQSLASASPEAALTGGLARDSGFYDDPNFHAAQISAALGGALLAQRRGRQPAVAGAVLDALLLYCGLLTASRMFLIAAAAALLLALLPGRPGDRRGSVVLLLGIGLLFSARLSAAVAAVLTRFTAAEDVSALTSQRSELWGEYLRAILSQPRLLLLGEGYSRVSLSGSGAHSTPLQMLYQLGLPGSLLLCAWLAQLAKDALVGRRAHLLWAGPLLAGAFLPWLSLDMLYFDEFFLVTLYALAGAAELGAEGCRGGGRAIFVPFASPKNG